MDTSNLGKQYSEGDVILRQGETTDGMFVIQEGEVEVLHERDGTEIRLNTLTQPDFFGEVPFFERVQDPGVVRATIRALGDVRVLTVDKATIVRRLHEDPGLGYRIMETMSRRMRTLEEEVIRLVIES
jgi:CRP/FNR family transcriptional regulator